MPHDVALFTACDEYPEHFIFVVSQIGLAACAEQRRGIGVGHAQRVELRPSRPLLELEGWRASGSPAWTYWLLASEMGVGPHDWL